MSISEQVKELRKIAREWEYNAPVKPIEKIFNEAADTIESLSAKLSAANMERSGKSALIIDAPRNCNDCPMFTVGGGTLDALCVGFNRKRKRIGTYIPSGIPKPDWCPLKDWSADGGRWIPCKERLPEDGQEVLASDGRYVYLVEYDGDLDCPFSDVENIQKWQPCPKP